MTTPLFRFLLAALALLMLAAIVRGGNSSVPVYYSLSGGTIGLTVVAGAQIGQTLTASDGTDFTPLANLPANQCRVVNMSGTTLEFRRGTTGATLSLPVNGTWVFRALTNTSQMQVRRLDQAATPVNVSYEGEAAAP